VEPDPEVAQKQRDGHEQEPQEGTAGGRADADLVHLLLAGLDADAEAVEAVDSSRGHADAAGGVEEGAVATAVPTAATQDAQVDGVGRWASRCTGSSRSGASRGWRAGRCAARPSGLAVDGLGHDERLAGGLQVADDAGGVEALVEKDQLGGHAGSGHPPTQRADDGIGERAASNPDNREGEPAAVPDQVGCGVGVELGGAGLGMSPEDLGRVGEQLARGRGSG
jgi:hypothetical protein